MKEARYVENPVRPAGSPRQFLNPGVVDVGDGMLWVPDGPKMVFGPEPNPRERWESWGKTTRATLFVGLKVERSTEFFDKGRKLAPIAVYGSIFNVRTSQVGVRYGGTFVQAKGHYIPKRARKVGQERRRREDSMQITLFPGKGETWAEFKRNIADVIEVVLDELGQESVIVEFMRDGRVTDLGEYLWTKERKGRDRIGGGR